MAKCENCGADDAQLIWSGYVTPIPDAAPTYSEWQEKYLCRKCQEDALQFPLRSEPKKKKPYSKPRLIVYGNIRDMTNANTTGSKSDHHHHRIGHKTQ
jgi:hypothetical protein